MRAIRITAEQKAQLKANFAAYIDKLVTGKRVNFSEPITLPAVQGKDGQKVEVLYTADAWRKQKALIDGFESEVAWHGIVTRVDTFHYVIEDILVYPQTVTGVTVDMDEVKYGQWTMDIDPEVLQTMRMQGHSHVNMSCFPSGTDDKHQEDIVQMLGKEEFYIFIIANKRDNVWCCVYDLKENIIFETNDIDVRYEVDAIEPFMAKAKEMVQTAAKTGGVTYYGNRNYTSDYHKWTDEDWERYMDLAYGDSWRDDYDNYAPSKEKKEKTKADEENKTKDDTDIVVIDGGYQYSGGRFQVI